MSLFVKRKTVTPCHTAGGPGSPAPGRPGGDWWELREASGRKGNEAQAKSSHWSRHKKSRAKPASSRKLGGRWRGKGAPQAVTAQEEVSELCFKVPGWVKLPG